jgi:hypothetical protein
MDDPARSQTRTASDEAARPATAKPPPVPEAGPLAEPKSPDQIGLPTELTRQAIPPDNPQTPDKIALGEKLFFDGRLSADGTVACSTCHDPARAFTDGRPTSVDLVAFLASLTSAQYREQGEKELARQREIARTNRPQRDIARAFGPKPRRPAPSALDPHTDRALP